MWRYTDNYYILSPNQQANLWDNYDVNDDEPYDEIAMKFVSKCLAHKKPHIGTQNSNLV